MTHHELMHRLGETVGIKLELSDMNTAAAKFDGDEVRFESSEGRLYLYADIAPAEGLEDEFGWLLESNNLFAETDGATIGLDYERAMITLCRVIDGTVAYSVFENIVAGFVTALRHLRSELSSGDDASAPGFDPSHYHMSKHSHSFMRV